MRNAAHEDVADQKDQRGKGRQRAQQHERAKRRGDHAPQSGAHRLAGARQAGAHRLNRVFHASFLLRSALHDRLISRMNTNSTTPVAISASRCRSAA